MTAALVSFRSLGKRFGEIPVLKDISFEISRGSVHALMGENGAGKSTLIKTLCGVYHPDEGWIEVEGETLPAGDIAESSRHGIAVIHQELAAFEDLSVSENIFLGREPSRLGGVFVDHQEQKKRSRDLLERLDVPMDPSARVGDLPTAQKQLVAIARALAEKAKLLIMDEPTASLSKRESDTLFRITRELVAGGGSVLYVSHRMEEIFNLSDTVTVLRDGCHIRTAPTKDLDPDSLVRLMVGRAVISENFSKKPDGVETAHRTALSVRGLSREGVFRDISFSIHQGEMVCLTGLVGSGRSELVNTLFGIHPADSGVVEVDGKKVAPGSPGQAMAAGLALVPEERSQQGLVLPMSVNENLLLPHLASFTRNGLRLPDWEGRVAGDLISALQIKTEGGGAPAGTLSGGNQQKVSLGKWLTVPPKVLLLDEPTRGVDVGAKAEIYRLLKELAAKGLAALVVSSDLPEVLALASRILIMREGQVVGELSRAEATQEKILAMALPQSPGFKKGRSHK